MATWERARLSTSRPLPPGDEWRHETISGARVRSVVVIVVVVVSTTLWVASAFSRRVGPVATVAPPPPAAVGTAVRPAVSSIRPQDGARTPAGFVVTFGEFSRRDEAVRQVRLVRSKGYLAVVTRSGSSLRVTSRTYDDRHEAEFWAEIFQEIGLPGTLESMGGLGLTTAD